MQSLERAASKNAGERMEGESDLSDDEDKIKIKSEFSEEDTEINYGDHLIKTEATSDINEDGVEKEEFDEEAQDDSDSSQKCEICEKSFATKQTLAVHKKRHEELHKCNVCKKEFFRSKDLSRHLKTHTKKEQKKCDVCNKEFSRGSDLNRHLKTHEKKTNNCNNCNICNKKYTDKQDLSAHIKLHTRETLNCKFCNTNISSSSNLRRHILSDRKEKPYKCGFCDKQYTAKYRLVKHATMHSSKCEICDENFDSRIELLKHIRGHTGEKPSKCEICEEKYEDPDDLAKHILIHTRENPAVFVANLFQKKLD